MKMLLLILAYTQDHGNKIAPAHLEENDNLASTKTTFSFHILAKRTNADC